MALLSILVPLGVPSMSDADFLGGAKSGSALRQPRRCCKHSSTMPSAMPRSVLQRSNSSKAGFGLGFRV